MLAMGGMKQKSVVVELHHAIGCCGRENLEMRSSALQHRVVW